MGEEYGIVTFEDVFVVLNDEVVPQFLQCTTDAVGGVVGTNGKTQCRILHQVDFHTVSRQDSEDFR